MHCYWRPLPREREPVVGGATAPTLAMVSRGESLQVIKARRRSDKGVRPFFHSHRRGRAVAGVDHRRVGESEELGVDSLKQLLEVSPLVGAADRAREEDIP